MNVFEIVADIIFYILGVYVDIRYIKLFLKPKGNSSVNKKLLCVVGFVVNWFVYQFTQNSFLLTISGFGALLFVAIFKYRGKLYEKMLVVTLVMAIGVAIEGIVWRLLVWLNGDNINGALGNLLSNLLLLFIAVTLERCISVDKEIRLPVGSYFNMLLVSIGGAVLAEILTDISGVPNIWVNFGLCIICIIFL